MEWPAKIETEAQRQAAIQRLEELAAADDDDAVAEAELLANLIEAFDDRDSTSPSAREGMRK